MQIPSMNGLVDGAAGAVAGDAAGMTGTQAIGNQASGESQGDKLRSSSLADCRLLLSRRVLDLEAYRSSPEGLRSQGV